MEKELRQLIFIGLRVPAHHIKRSSWVKVERVMEYLVNVGAVRKKNGDIRYITDKSYYELARIYSQSPLSDHVDEMKKLSREMNLPLNSKELLNEFLKLK